MKARPRSRLDTLRRDLNGLIAQQLAGARLTIDGRHVLVLGVEKTKIEFAVYAKVGQCERYMDALDFSSHVVRA